MCVKISGRIWVINALGKGGKKSMSHSNQELDKLAIRQLERKIKEAKEEQKLLEKEAKELKK